MHVRHAIVAVAITVALTVSACSNEPDAAPTITTTAGATQSPSTTASGTPEATPPTSPTPPAAAGTIRPIQPGFSLESVAQTLRSGFAGFADKSDDEIATILNAACDAMDATGTPLAGADAIQSYGVDAYDAAFSVSAAVSLYCPEYTKFIDGTNG